MYRLRADPSAISRTNPSNVPPIVLPDTSSGSIDWNSLVNVASRTLEGMNLICFLFTCELLFKGSSSPSSSALVAILFYTNGRNNNNSHKGHN